ncbi:hypothetical protein [Microbacterium sp. Bi128]|uniref:hypothetical protein n=1 Tax=Microbacterium sp. Bi128 TaxID=2821115 RepID=UPI001E46AEF5|nr:hypothetical protein [Microbacterium sp. Bi128]
MTSGSGDGGRTYEWQSWPSDSLEGMPPKRRRLVVWGLLWLFLLSGVLQGVLSAVGIPEPWRSVVFAAALAAVFVPLIRGAAAETRALRAEGVDMPAVVMTRKALVVLSVITGGLWIVFAVLAFLGESASPLVPIAWTIVLAFQGRSWRSLPR